MPPPTGQRRTTFEEFGLTEEHEVQQARRDTHWGGTELLRRYRRLVAAVVARRIEPRGKRIALPAPGALYTPVFGKLSKRHTDPNVERARLRMLATYAAAYRTRDSFYKAAAQWRETFRTRWPRLQRAKKVPLCVARVQRRYEYAPWCVDTATNAASASTGASVRTGDTADWPSLDRPLLDEWLERERKWRCRRCALESTVGLHTARDRWPEASLRPGTPALWRTDALRCALLSEFGDNETIRQHAERVPTWLCPSYDKQWQDNLYDTARTGMHGIALALAEQLTNHTENAPVLCHAYLYFGTARRTLRELLSHKDLYWVSPWSCLCTKNAPANPGRWWRPIEKLSEAALQTTLRRFAWRACVPPGGGSCCNDDVDELELEDTLRQTELWLDDPMVADSDDDDDHGCDHAATSTMYTGKKFCVERVACDTERRSVWNERDENTWRNEARAAGMLCDDPLVERWLERDRCNDEENENQPTFLEWHTAEGLRKAEADNDAVRVALMRRRTKMLAADRKQPRRRATRSRQRLNLLREHERTVWRHRHVEAESTWALDRVHRHVVVAFLNQHAYRDFSDQFCFNVKLKPGRLFEVRHTRDNQIQKGHMLEPPHARTPVSCTVNPQTADSDNRRANLWTKFVPAIRHTFFHPTNTAVLKRLKEPAVLMNTLRYMSRPTGGVYSDFDGMQTATAFACAAEVGEQEPEDLPRSGPFSGSTFADMRVQLYAPRSIAAGPPQGLSAVFSAADDDHEHDNGGTDEEDQRAKNALEHAHRAYARMLAEWTLKVWETNHFYFATPMLLHAPVESLLVNHMALYRSQFPRLLLRLQHRLFLARRNYHRRCCWVRTLCPAPKEHSHLDRVVAAEAIKTLEAAQAATDPALARAMRCRAAAHLKIRQLEKRRFQALALCRNDSKPTDVPMSVVRAMMHDQLYRYNDHQLLMRPTYALLTSDEAPSPRTALPNNDLANGAAWTSSGLVRLFPPAEVILHGAPSGGYFQALDNHPVLVERPKQPKNANRR